MRGKKKKRGLRFYNCLITTATADAATATMTTPVIAVATITIAFLPSHSLPNLLKAYFLLYSTQTAIHIFFFHICVSVDECMCFVAIAHSTPSTIVSLY